MSVPVSGQDDLPGSRHQAGWFRGDEGRVFAAIGKGGQCVLLPGNEGTALILSPQEPEKLLAVLHQQVVDRR